MKLMLVYLKIWQVPVNVPLKKLGHTCIPNLKQYIHWLLTVSTVLTILGLGSHH